MSQEKINNRKKSKGDLLHAAKKKMRISLAVVIVVLIALGGLSTKYFYDKGYDKGSTKGKADALQTYLESQTTEESTTEESTTEEATTEATTTEAQ